MPKYPDQGPVQETLNLPGAIYEIVEQRAGEYAVRKMVKGHESEWLKHPELHFETMGGCYHAILLDMEG